MKSKSFLDTMKRRTVIDAKVSGSPTLPKVLDIVSDFEMGE
jgi:hypothetical protein